MTMSVYDLAVKLGERHGFANGGEVYCDVDHQEKDGVIRADMAMAKKLAATAQSVALSVPQRGRFLRAFRDASSSATSKRVAQLRRLDAQKEG